MGFRVKHLKGAIATVLLSGVCAIAESLPSLAGGFTQPKNFNFTSLSYSNFDTDTFHKQEIQFYLEHGLQDNLTLIFKSPFAWSKNDDRGGDENSGFAPQETGIRWRFNRDPYWATALQANIIVPLGYDADDDPSGAGNQDVGLEVSLPVSRGFQVGKQRFGYGTVEVGYRDYFGSSSDELRLTGELSVDILRRFALATQFYGIYRLRESDNEDFSKIGGQMRWGANDNLTLSVGGFKNLTEFGGSFEAQIWYTFGAGKKAESETPTPPTEPKSP
ncbi:hypothetical protein [Chroococcidiopsis sp. CCNUC1]|uniref:hypothetical protein n=1 Tax=Chroococcidiopsis sp. CCNUC1 TaxID=2653189 RepID=UPI000D066A9E|nr:hypothetical protein [Chroococcidiopsis sp. CCNUC1]PSB49037.1 hypothetical protein C7B80_03530 [Cyanosarcina cf. burmensis CCALA 770]URD47728.1 hypothetical protein M5J74_15435 [Chroococcidiopsis sp. CCNUC1]